MVRIIPWKLPDVAGGSVGGYTPRGGGGGGDDQPPADHYDFSGAGLKYGAQDNKAGIKYSGDVVSGYRATISGIVTNDVIGVSQVTVLLEGTGDGSTITNIVFDLSPADPNVITGLISTDSVYGGWTENVMIVSKMTFIVYGADGTVVETEEVTLS